MQIAQDVTAVQQSQALDSNFLIIATARPGQPLDKIQAVIDEELDRLRAAPPEAREMQRALNQIEANFFRGMERVGGFGGKSNQLNSYYKSARHAGLFPEGPRSLSRGHARRHQGRGRQIFAKGSAGGTERRSGREEMMWDLGCADCGFA